MGQQVGSTSPGPEVVETHVSTVALIGDRAYKLLKPVTNAFLDFSTVERRLVAVDQEIELNRRLAPDVYLGSADVVEDGRVVDRFIVMRRMPAERRLPELVTSGELQPCLRAVARLLATFHQAQEPLVDAGSIAGAEAVLGNWRGNFAYLDDLPDGLLPPGEADRVRELAERFLRHRGALFDRRVEEGFVRDGHGDLTAQDIFCLPDGPRVLDCLAFDPGLRIGDVLSDIGFLAMDLHRLAGVGAARDLIGWYCEFSGEHHPASLAHHYVAYRANVRAKVEAIRHDQGEPGAASALADYHHLCRQHLERGQLTLVLIGGSPGTGKTTVAGKLSTALGYAVLSTDELRKDLAGRPHLVHERTAPGAGIYSDQMSDRTYGELIRRAGLLIDRGESVVLDASWSRAEHRAAARTLAATLGARLIELECVLGPETARLRIESRLADGRDPSDARPELLTELRARQQRWPEATPVDTSDPADAVLAAVLDSTFPEAGAEIGQGLISR